MVMNCWNVRYGTRIQDIFAYAKVVALIIIIIIGFYYLGAGMSILYIYIHLLLMNTIIVLFKLIPIVYCLCSLFCVAAMLTTDSKIVCLILLQSRL